MLLSSLYSVPWTGGNSDCRPASEFTHLSASRATSVNTVCPELRPSKSIVANKAIGCLAMAFFDQILCRAEGHQVAVRAEADDLAGGDGGDDEWRRNSSRAWTFDRWTSIVGRRESAMASRMAYE